MAITSGNQNHSCGKRDCYYCYEMNRIKHPKPEYKIRRRNTYEYHKHRLLTLADKSLKVA